MAIRDRSEDFAEKVIFGKSPGFSLVRTVTYEAKNVHTDKSAFDYEYFLARLVSDSCWDPDIHLYTIFDSNAIVTQPTGSKIIKIEYQNNPLQPLVIKSAKSNLQRHSRVYSDIAKCLRSGTYKEESLFDWDFSLP